MEGATEGFALLISLLQRWHSSENQFQETSGARLLLLESSSPGMELMPVDMLFPAKGGDVHAACCLGLDDGAPMGSSFRFGHHILPPNKEIFLFWEL